MPESSLRSVGVQTTQWRLCSPGFVLEKADNEAVFEEALKEESCFNASDCTGKGAVLLRAMPSGSCRNLQGCDLTAHDDALRLDLWQTDSIAVKCRWSIMCFARCQVITVHPFKKQMHTHRQQHIAWSEYTLLVHPSCCITKMHPWRPAEGPWNHKQEAPLYCSSTIQFYQIVNGTLRGIRLETSLIRDPYPSIRKSSILKQK